MKIAHVITGLNGGGAQYLLLNLVKRLNPSFQNEVISLSNFGIIGEQLAANGVPVVALEMKPGAIDLAGVSKLRSLLMKSKPDLVHTWMYHSDLIGGVAARLAGGPKLLWAVHSPDIDPRYTKRKTAWIARGCAALSNLLPDRVVYVSEDTRQNHIRIGYSKKNSSVIPGGYDLEKLRPDPQARARIRTELAIPQDALVAGIIARFNPQKGYRQFCQVAALLRRTRPGMRFVLAGRDVDQKNTQLVSWLTEAGILDAATLLGPRADVPDVLNALDILLSPSLGEAGPLIIGEALACGVPCVGTRVGLTSELIGEPQFVTTPLDCEAMAMAAGQILDMTQSERAALGEKSHRRIVENFSLEKMAQEYAQLYEQMRPASARG